MQMFGLISLVVTIALGVWFVAGSSLGTVEVVDENGVRTESSYQAALDSAQTAADSINRKTSLTGTKITVYEGISIPDDAQVLDLSGKGLSGSLKSEIRHLTNLRELDVSNNNFTGLPAEVGHLPKLEKLNLSNNPFTGLPQELGNLKNLKVLDLRRTQYSTLDLDFIKKSLPSDTQVLID